MLAGVRPALVLPTTLLVLADGSISTAPPAPASISVPDAAMAGNNISVAWETVKGANIYKLERSVNPDGWVTVYTGAGLKYIDKAGDWTSVQYRASAGSTIGTTQYGEPIVSKTVNIVPVNYIKNIHAGRQYWGNQGGDNVYSIERRSPRRYLHFGGF